MKKNMGTVDKVIRIDKPDRHLSALHAAWSQYQEKGIIKGRLLFMVHIHIPQINIPNWEPVFSKRLCSFHKININYQSPRN